MFRLIIILIASSSIKFVSSHPEPSIQNHVSTSYEADDSLNNVTNDTDSKVTDSKIKENEVLSGVKKMLAQEKPEDIVDSIAKKILEYAKTNSKPKSRRSNDRALVQPAIVHFESKRPSVMLKMDTTNLVDVLANALKSKTVQSYVQHYSRRAAQAFNVVKQKLDEVDSKNIQ